MRQVKKGPSSSQAGKKKQKGPAKRTRSEGSASTASQKPKKEAKRKKARSENSASNASQRPKASAQSGESGPSSRTRLQARMAEIESYN